MQQLATRSITELGFVRIVSQISAYNISLEQAREELKLLKVSQNYDFQFVADANDISHLPNWVKLAKHTTDGHLAELARANGAELATFDAHIPRCFLIP